MAGGALDREHSPPEKLEWNWELEHKDRAKEAKADRAVHHAQPFLVDRKLLKDVVKDKFQLDVARIVFLSSGEFRSSTEHISLRRFPSFYRNVPQGKSMIRPQNPIADIP